MCFIVVIGQTFSFTFLITVDRGQVLEEEHNFLLKKELLLVVNELGKCWDIFVQYLNSTDISER